MSDQFMEIKIDDGLGDVKQVQTQLENETNVTFCSIKKMILVICLTIFCIAVHSSSKLVRSTIQDERKLSFAALYAKGNYVEFRIIEFFGGEVRTFGKIMSSEQNKETLKWKYNIKDCADGSDGEHCQHMIDRRLFDEDDILLHVTSSCR